MSLQWPNYLVDSVDKTKHSLTVSPLSDGPFFLLVPELTIVFAAVFPTGKKIEYEETDGKGMMHMMHMILKVCNLTSVY